MGKKSQTLILQGNYLELNGFTVAELSPGLPRGSRTNLAEFLAEFHDLQMEQEKTKRELEKVKDWLEEAADFVGRMIDPPGGL